MNSTDKIIDYLNNLDEVKRFKELDNYISKNKAINPNLKNNIKKETQEPNTHSKDKNSKKPKHDLKK